MLFFSFYYNKDNFLKIMIKKNIMFIYANHFQMLVLICISTPAYKNITAKTYFVLVHPCSIGGHTDFLKSSHNKAEKN